MELPKTAGALKGERNEMPIPGAVVVPHPPVIIPTVGQGREKQVQKTVDAYRAAARRVVNWRPNVVILLSPHMVMYADYFHIAPGRSASGSMAAFGAPETRIDVTYDRELRQEIVQEAMEMGLRAGTLGEQDRSLDHGSFVPLYFLKEAGMNCPIVRIGLSGFPPLVHYQMGQCIQRAVNRLKRRAVVVASGDLSHKMREDGPYGFTPEGPQFDAAVTSTMISANFLEFLTIDPVLCEKAAQCGLRSFQIMAGVLDGLEVVSNLLSYESTFGVGYGVATFTALDRTPYRKYADRYQEDQHRRLEKRREGEDPYVRLARLALETYVNGGGTITDLPAGLPAEMRETMGGAFVSLHLGGKLRGCIGTTRATTPCLAKEIIQNAISAGTGDPRFPPVTKKELEQLEYSVDVLERPRTISSPQELDVHRYGVIVSYGRKQGLLLPDLEGVDTVEDQIDIARRKAGIPKDLPLKLQRFEVVRHK